MNVKKFFDALARMVSGRKSRPGAGGAGAAKAASQPAPSQQHEKAKRESVRRARQAARITRRNGR